MDKTKPMFEINVAALQEFIIRPWKHSPEAMCLKYISPDSKVLDLGCAQGYMANLLKPKHCYVAGIEKDASAAEIAKRYCREVLVMDIEHGGVLPFPNNFFDLILCLDVLEHLARPDLVLGKLVNYLSAEGKLIVSLPNIARFEHRINLFFGRFDYDDSVSALSKGHLRLFTLKTAKKLVTGAGLRIAKVEFTGLHSIVKLFPALTAFQILIIAEKDNSAKLINKAVGD